MSIAVSRPTAQADSHPESEYGESVHEDAHWRNVLVPANAVDHYINPNERVLELPFANIQEFELHIHDSPDPFPCTNNSCDGRLMGPRREEDPAQPLRPTHVRFRSRVRITSGFRRYRRQSSLHHQTAIDHDLFTSSSPGSSLSSDSSSAPSSVSAPLRAGGEPGKSGWGVLGHRIRFLSHNNSQRQKSRKGRRETKHMIIANERTPLTLSPAHPSYLDPHTIEYDSLVHEDSEELRVSQRIWPRRLPSNRVCSKVDPPRPADNTLAVVVAHYLLPKHRRVIFFVE